MPPFPTSCAGAVAAAALAAGLLAGCAADDEEPAAGPQPAPTVTARTTPVNAERIPVAAAFYPIAEAVSRVGGDRVAVQNLTPPGSGPHDLELNPRQVEELAGARAVFYLSGGFQPAVADAVNGMPAQARKVDVLEGMELLPVGEALEGTQGEVDGETLEDGGDPHVWVDPVLQSEIAERAATVLTELDPDGAADYERNLEVYAGELADLSAAYRSGLTTCQSRVIVTSHRAFEYLARRYGLVQIPIAGLSPEDEPDPRSLAAVAAAAKEDNVRTVFFEEQAPAAFAETVAREIGAGTGALDPVETITADDLDAGIDYAAIMRKNLAALTSGLGCT